MVDHRKDDPDLKRPPKKKPLQTIIDYNMPTDEVQNTTGTN